MSTTQLLTTPLTDAEYDRLDELLKIHSTFDMDGVLGLLHAIALAPNTIGPSSWLPLATSCATETNTVAETSTLLVRLFAEVLDVTNRGQAMVPDEDDVAGCMAFATGYVAGASLDPLWRDDADCWTFAEPFAYLASQDELVSDATLAKYRARDDMRAVIRREMTGLLGTTHATFRKVRQIISARVGLKGVATAGPRIGRNELCPCGSGKKYKRCCLGRTTETST